MTKTTRLFAATAVIVFVLGLLFAPFTVELTHANTAEQLLLEDYKIEGGPSINFNGGGISGNLGGYLEFIVKLGIGIGIGISVVMLIVGGVRYVTTDTFTGKDEGKNNIQRALGGLLLLLTSGLLLITVNPALLSRDVQLMSAEVDSCGHIVGEHEDALDQWMSFNKDWEWHGGPYTKKTEYDENKKAVCLPDYDSCAEVKSQIDEHNENGGKPPKESSGIYAECVVCGKEKGSCSKEKTSAGENEQVYLFTCERVIIVWAGPDFSTDCDQLRDTPRALTDEEKYEQCVSLDQRITFLENLNSTMITRMADLGTRFAACGDNQDCKDDIQSQLDDVQEKFDENTSEINQRKQACRQ